LQNRVPVDDYHALLEILAHTIAGVDRTALSLLLENARRKTIRIWAEQAPFDLKDELKKRGYRRSSGCSGLIFRTRPLGDRA
jgi:DNA polymerase-3 subunit epsilon